MDLRGIGNSPGDRNGGLARAPENRPASDVLPVLAVIVVVWLCFEVAVPQSHGGAGPARAVPVNLEALMHNVARNEVQARQHPAHYYEYRLRQRTLQGSTTRLQIDTPQGSISRLVTGNGKPPTAKQCEKDMSLLRRVASTPSLQQSRLKAERANMARREQLFSALGNAFLFQYEGVEKGTGWIRLNYKPNPQFRPRNRVGGVLEGLEGTMWVDPQAQRLARVQGSLVRDVTFGWGILARLYRGGHFVLRQTKLPDGEWRVRTLSVRFQGTILLFRKLNVNMTRSFSDFKEIPENLTIAQAVAMLEHAPIRCTQ